MVPRVTAPAYRLFCPSYWTFCVMTGTSRNKRMKVTLTGLQPSNFRFEFIFEAILNLNLDFSTRIPRWFGNRNLKLEFHGYQSDSRNTLSIRNSNWKFKFKFKVRNWNSKFEIEIQNSVIQIQNSKFFEIRIQNSKAIWISTLCYMINFDTNGVP